MLKKRVIPILTFDGKSLVKTRQFKNPRTVGNPVQAARVFNSRNVDELVFIDIYATKENRKINLSLVKKIIDECFMPITIGGGIRDFEDIKNLLNIGADKVLIKSMAINDTNFIKKAINYFGSPTISVSIDIYKINEIYFVHNLDNLVIDAKKYLQQIKDLKVGEIILNSVDMDGIQKGFDLEMIKDLSQNTSIPIVVAGGAGELIHFEQLFSSGYDGAVGVSSMFFFTQFTPNDIKKKLKLIGAPVRI